MIPLLSHMQDLFREWHQLDQRQRGSLEPAPAGHAEDERQLELSVPFEYEAFKKQALENRQRLQAWAICISTRRPAPATPPDPERRVNALAVSLHPESWEEDGLYTTSRG